MDSLTLPSYAKINLGLYVKNKREDGYHEIETVLHQISLRDRIELKRKADNNDIVLTSNDESIPDGSENLCVKAAALLKRHFGLFDGVHIHLEKNIPVGAGLGGGSSNAAVVLLGLNKLWQTNCDIRRLQEMGAELGSDVPFFIAGGSAHASGRGEILKALQLENPLHILVVYPRIHISTTWAYNQVNLDLTRTAKSVKLAYFNNLDWSHCDELRSLINQFESVITSTYPEIGEIKKEMQATRAIYSSLSGTGSAVFGMFRHLDDATKLKREFEKEYQCFLTKHIHWGYGQI